MHEATGTIVGYGENYIDSFLPFLHSKEDIKDLLLELKENKKKFKKVLKSGFVSQLKKKDRIHKYFLRGWLLSFYLSLSTAALSISSGRMAFFYIIFSLNVLTGLADALYLNIVSNNLAEAKIDLITGVLKTQVEDEETEDNMEIEFEREKELDVTSDLRKEIEECLCKTQILKYPGYLNDLIILHQMLKHVIKSDNETNLSIQLSFIEILDKIKNRINNALDSIALESDKEKESMAEMGPHKSLTFEPVDKK